MNFWEREVEPPCVHCLDSGLLRSGPRLYPCSCQAGWATRDAQRNYCGKVISGKRCIAMYSRPTVLHMVSRLYLMCLPCFTGFRRYRGLPDYHQTVAPKGLRCGSLVIITEGGKEPDFISKSAPDYNPVEDPRQFGLHMRGGDLVKRWEQQRAEESR